MSVLLHDPLMSSCCHSLNRPPNDQDSSPNRPRIDPGLNGNRPRTYPTSTRKQPRNLAEVFFGHLFHPPRARQASVRQCSAVPGLKQHRPPREFTKLRVAHYTHLAALRHQWSKAAGFWPQVSPICALRGPDKDARDGAAVRPEVANRSKRSRARVSSGAR